MDDYCYGAAHEIYAGAFSKDFIGLTFTDAAESVMLSLSDVIRRIYLSHLHKVTIRPGFSGTV